ncbi:MAG TPA: ATP-dependent DNA helicase RecG [Candidatus Atribacteria bacterium]|nr:ATP-dependent DNA helicase RecG [Candidatus Atribacteria bacterium]HPT77803.1 ATP-dependent DNA helicase RecG [Candidatus Atribacteria bacterium]
MKRLSDSISSLKGVGPKKASLLHRLGILTLEDALNHFPRDYEEIKAAKPIEAVVDGEISSVCAIFEGSSRTKRAKGLTVTYVKAYDDTGLLECVWFNQPYRATLYKPDIPYFIRGKATRKGKILQMQNPTVESYDPRIHSVDRLLPIYPLTRGLTQNDLRNVIHTILDSIEREYIDAFDRLATEEYGLISKASAYKLIHFPDNLESLRLARKRLKFDEFFTMLVSAGYQRKALRSGITGKRISVDNIRVAEFLDNLPFKLTESQQKVLTDIYADLSGEKVMNRLIQGDVGSGKTVIAAAAMCASAASGHQSAMMVPTEILARQHMETMSRMFEKTNIRLSLLTGRMSNAEKSLVKRSIAEGTTDIVIGTHAVLQQDVLFKDLALVITDEQHRFGVRQRMLLRSKGEGTMPHFLVMSATPIPRTLAQALYGDLDVSILEGKPPGRMPVKTHLIPSSLRDRLYNFIRNRALGGEQAYIVCPQIENASDGMKSAEELYAELTKTHLKGITTGLIHGRLDPDEKEKIMERFAKGQIKVLVSTTVIEVGINVPNATVIAIENAERFGLAQLHQLRGRVGRGDKPSYCILISDAKDETTKARLMALVRTNDGFDLAEKDLQLRGPGDLYGIRQHGLPQFTIANPLMNMDIFTFAQKAAKEVLEKADQAGCRKIIEICLEKHNKLAAMSD